MPENKRRHRIDARRGSSSESAGACILIADIVHFSGMTEEKGTLEFTQDTVGDEVYEAMAQSGVLYGHKKSRKNPKFQEYVFSTRNGVEVLDLQKTIQGIDIVSQMMKKHRDDGKLFLLVGTQPAAREAVQKLSIALGDCPFVAGKWIGGLMTNFSMLSRRLEYFKKKKSDMEAGKFEKYTKKERLLIERELEKLSEKFAGLANLTRVPDVLFVVDGTVKNHGTAIREARIKNATILGIIDNDDNPDDFDYFIPGNDHAKASIDWIVDSVIEKIKN